jgi:hypothetical protein
MRRAANFSSFRIEKSTTTMNNETNNDEIRYSIQLPFHLLPIHVTISRDSSVGS